MDYMEQKKVNFYHLFVFGKTEVLWLCLLDRSSCLSSEDFTCSYSTEKGFSYGSEVVNRRMPSISSFPDLPGSLFSA